MTFNPRDLFRYDVGGRMVPELMLMSNIPGVDLMQRDLQIISGIEREMIIQVIEEKLRLDKEKPKRAISLTDV